MYCCDSRYKQCLYPPVLLATVINYFVLYQPKKTLFLLCVESSAIRNSYHQGENDTTRGKPEHWEISPGT